jgi:hypothetical protein
MRASLASLCLATIGCRGCKDEKPFVPFSMSEQRSSEPPPETSASPSAAVSASAYPVVLASPPTGDGRTFTSGDRSWAAPQGRVFRAAIPLADDDPRLLAWVERPSAASGALVVVDAAGESKTLAPIPKDLDIERCAHVATLSRVGEKVYALGLALTCGDAAKSVLFVARVEGDEVAVRYEAAAESGITLRATTARRDDDANADLVVTATGAGGGLAPTAELVYLDRGAGYAADPTEPDGSLAKHGKALLSNAIARKPTVLADARATLAFATALCSDVGRGAVTSSAGSPKCKESRVFGDAVHAAALVHDKSGDLLRTVAAAEIAVQLKHEYGRVAQIEQLFSKKVTKVTALVSPLAGRSTAPWPGAELRFGADGALSIRSGGAWTTVDPKTNAELPAAFDDTPADPAFGRDDSTVTLERIVRGCADATTAVGTLARGAHRDTQLPLVGSGVPWSLRKDTCDAAPPAATLVSFGESKATITIDGEAFDLVYGDAGVEAKPVAFSAPEPWVVPLARSLVVARAGARERWTAKEGLVGLHSCRLAPSGDLVACVRGAAIVVVTKEKKPAKGKG